MGSQAGDDTAGGSQPLDDAALVARAQRGDLAAFENLVRRYQHPVYRFALRMLNDRGEAEDITQDVFVTTWRQLSTIRDGAALRAWLYRITANRCRNLLRGRHPTGPLGDLDATPTAGSPSTETQAEAAEQLRALRVALDALTPEQRTCWLLAEVEQLSYAEIADVEQTSPQAVRGRLARARAKLGEAMRSWR